MPEFLAGLFLFDGLTSDEIGQITSLFPPTVRRYRKGETVAAPDAFERAVGFIRRGRCSVAHPRGDDDLLPMPLNTLRETDSFGVLTVFAEDLPFPSVIEAAAETEILFFAAEQLESMMLRFPRIALNVTRFLAGRVVFLNRKIDAFAGRCCEEKLASFLLAEYEKSGPTFSFSAQRTARELNIGRASLYRALDGMKESGILSCESRTLTVHHADALRNFYKKGIKS